MDSLIEDSDYDGPSLSVFMEHHHQAALAQRSVTDMGLRGASAGAGKAGKPQKLKVAGASRQEQSTVVEVKEKKNEEVKNFNTFGEQKDGLNA